MAVAPTRASFAPLSLPTATASRSGSGLQFAHSLDNTSRNNVPQGFGNHVQAYEVPTQSIDRKDGGPKYQNVPPAHSQVSAVIVVITLV